LNRPGLCDEAFERDHKIDLVRASIKVIGWITSDTQDLIVGMSGQVDAATKLAAVAACTGKISNLQGFLGRFAASTRSAWCHAVITSVSSR
jgi:hypothetical protein